MFGAVSRYLFEYVLGIRQTKDAVRYEKIVIRPMVMDQIPWAKGHITTDSGVIGVDYDEKRICVTVPRGVEAVLILNGKETALSGGAENVICR